MKFAIVSLCLAAALSPLLFDQPVRWAGSRLHGSPEPGKPFIEERVFETVPLNNALDMVPVPGLEQWLFVENGGKIWTVPNKTDTTRRNIAIDLKAFHEEVDHAYGVAFHPRFRETREVFITYTNGNDKPDGSRLSRFKVTQDQPLIIDPASEEILLTWLSGGHNGAAMAFGADGMLYLTAGDAEVPAPPDPLVTGQDLADFLCTVLRIDVDHRDDGKTYAVPKDNPFVSIPKAKPEIWCIGLRNPWKLSFDRITNTMWCGDVGWEQWENIYLIKRGANYGWSATEGNNPILLERKHPTIPITPPVVTHSHSEAASITGGFVYRGKRLTGLEGAYVYADYESGKIWALRTEGQKLVKHEEIADTALKIVTFGQGEDGELYFIHYSPQGTVHRLVPNPNAGKQSDFPRKLSETGLFANVLTQTPATGVQSFDIAAPMWADGAKAKRYAAIPSGSIATKLSLDKQTNTVRGKAAWPAESVLAKTISMKRDESNPATSVPLETQVLHYDGIAWNAYSYRWNEQGTDAVLVGDAGDERVFELTGKRFPEGHQRYRYRFHSRTECLRCHNSWSGFALGFQPQQIVDPSPLLASALFDGNFLKQSDSRLVPPHDPTASTEARARSWLHANCAHCHREHGGGAVPTMLNIELALADTRTLAAKPTRGDFGITGAEVLAPSVPWYSVLLHRVATQGTNHMPMIGAQTADTQALHLLQTWIMSMEPSATTTIKHPLSTVRLTAPKPGWVSSISEWVALQKTNNRALDELMSDAAGAAFVAHAIDTHILPPNDRARAIKLGATSPNSHIYGLFERFLADSERIETLGAVAAAEKITTLQGDTKRGAALLSSTGKAAACFACHLVKGTGRDFGPDLSQIGARLTKDQIIESLLTPSKTISQGYGTTVVTMKNGGSQTGFIVKRTNEELSLKIVTGESLPMKTNEIIHETTAPVSLMPEGLLQFFTAQEAADLVAYLGSLK